MSAYADAHNHHCENCRWAAKVTGVTNEPFDEAILLARVRDLVVGDVVFFDPVNRGSRSHCRGRVTAVEPEGRKRRVTIDWEACETCGPAVEHDYYKGVMLALAREGRPRGRDGQLGEVEYAVAV